MVLHVYTRIGNPVSYYKTRMTVLKKLLSHIRRNVLRGADRLDRLLWSYMQGEVVNTSLKRTSIVVSASMLAPRSVPGVKLYNSLSQ